MDSQSLINPLALFSSRYRFLVRSNDTLNKCWPGFRLLLLKSFGLTLQNCRRDFQELNFTVMDLTFLPVFYLCRFSQSYGHDHHFHLGMEDSFLRSILLPVARHYQFFHHCYIQFHESLGNCVCYIVPYHHIWMAIFPSSSSIFGFCSSNFSSNLEIISFFNYLNMSSKITLVANGLTTSEKYSQISCDREIFVVFAGERVTAIWKPCTIYFRIKCLKFYRS